MQWYYAINGERRGPVTQSEFEKLAADGGITASTLVWHQGLANWAPYASVAGTGSAVLSAVVAGSGDDTEVCVVSGLHHPKREMIQYEGKWISAERRDEFFQRQREGVVGPKDFIYGNFWPRFCAKFLDGVITGVAGILFNMSVALALFGTANYFGGAQRGADVTRLLVFQAITLPGGILIGLAYVWFFISRYQATPGKMALGLIIVRPDGSKLSTGRIIGRHFAEMINIFTLMIGYLIAASDPERRALHDRICDTRVIKAK